MRLFRRLREAWINLATIHDYCRSLEINRREAEKRDGRR